MKKFLSLVVCTVVLAVCVSLVAPYVSNVSEVSAANEEKVVKSANEARFLNMLNHNFVYNSDFDDVDTIVNNATLAILDLRDENNEDFISEAYVKGFVNDMYGIEIVDMSELNAEFPKAEGYVYIIPRGFTSYEHSIVSIKQNEDGSYTVVSDVTSYDHDGAPQTQKAVSLFVENEESAFGYNIIYCNIVANGTDI